MKKEKTLLRVGGSDSYMDIPTHSVALAWWRRKGLEGNGFGLAQNTMNETIDSFAKTTTLGNFLSLFRTRDKTNQNGVTLAFTRFRPHSCKHSFRENPSFLIMQAANYYHSFLFLSQFHCIQGDFFHWLFSVICRRTFAWLLFPLFLLFRKFW